MRNSPILLGILLTVSASTAAADTVLQTVEVNTAAETEPLQTTQKISTTPRAYSDAAELLKDVSGMSVARQAGASSTPYLRGLTGSRLPIVADGAVVEGACNHGMDPATSYIQPDAYDKLIVIKGPNTVSHGLAMAGSVEFVRDLPRADSASQLRVGLGAGSFARHDETFAALINTQSTFIRTNFYDSGMGNYHDANGDEVHSHYARYGGNANLGWRINSSNLLEFSAAASDGEAAYPAYHMDGTQFRRKDYALRWSSENILPWFKHFEINLRQQNVAHLMDDFSMRAPHETVTDLGFGNFTRDTSYLTMVQNWHGESQNILADFALPANITARVGLDWRQDHFFANNDVSDDFCLTLFGTTTCTHSRVVRPFYDLSSEQQGMFAELLAPLGENLFKFGIRHETRETRAGDLRSFDGTTVLPGANSTRNENNRSAFVRWERPVELSSTRTLNTFVALAYAERPADYIERGSFAGFFLRPEKNTEVNTGVQYQSESFELGLNLFYSQIRDFILTYQGTSSFNVDARRRGGELNMRFLLMPNLHLDTAYSRMQADNVTMNVPLAQTPPSELRVAFDYRLAQYGLNLNSRIASAQKRVHVGYGNSTGSDLGPSEAFQVYGLNAFYQATRKLKFDFGIDNITNKQYAEHLNKTGSFAPTGFVASTRVFEPGRAVWMKASWRE